MRYSELKKYLPHISYKMPLTQLSELEDDGFITRSVYPVVPPKVEHALTNKGRQVIPDNETIRLYGMLLMREAGIDPNIVCKKSVSRLLTCQLTTYQLHHL